MLKIFFILFGVIAADLALAGDLAAINSIPYKPEPTDSGGVFYKVILSLLVVSGLAYLIAMVIKKYIYGSQFQGKSLSKLNMLELKRISPKLTLFRLEVNGNEICLAQTDKDIIVLDKVKLESKNENEISDVN